MRHWNRTGLVRRLVAGNLLAAALLAGAGHAVASELADLIRSGERRAAIALIESGIDVNEAQGDGTTPLHWAVYHVDAELVGMLLAAGASADAINLYGSSPLGEAVRVAAVPLVERLLAAGADVESANADGQTVLMLATRSGSAGIVQLLIENGADVNAKESWRGQSALMWAADSGFPEIVDLLIANGAEVDFRAMSTDWPSQITSEPRAQYRPVGGLTPLLYAARSGCNDCVRSILAAGADIDRPTPEGMTPLIVAIDNRAFDTAALLLEAGANPHLWDWYGRTALYVAIDIKNYGRGADVTGGVTDIRPVTADQIVRLLLDAGVDPDFQLNMHRPSRGGNIGRFTDDLLTTGATPLLRAAVSQDLESIEALLAGGATVELANVQGVTPLIAAAGIGSARNCGPDGGPAEDRAVAAVQLLLDAGADVNARVVASYNRSATIARLSSMTGREGHSALITAVCRGWERVVDLLLANGAEADIVDAYGRSPIDIALRGIGESPELISEAIAGRLQAHLAGSD